MKCLIVIFILSYISLPCLCRSQEKEIPSSCGNFIPSAKDDKNMFEARPDSRPWLVLVWVSCKSLFFQSGSSAQLLVKTCEGAIVGDKWVLTVASCFQDCQGGVELASATVDVGLHSSDIRKEIAAGRTSAERIPVDRIYSSEKNFRSGNIEELVGQQTVQNTSFSSDLALLRLSTSAGDQNRVISLPNCSEKLLPTSMPSQNGSSQMKKKDRFLSTESPLNDQTRSSRERKSRDASDTIEGGADSNCLVSSWGGIASPTAALQEMGLRLLSQDECDQISGDSLLTQGLVCAGVSTNSSVSLAEWERVVSDFRPDCAVQQGTPLVVPQEVQGDEMGKQCEWKLLGLLSFGLGCHQSRNDTQSEKEGNISTPGFFSSVCGHVPWIEATIEQHEALVSAACPVLPQPPPNGYICSREGSSTLIVEVCCDRGYLLEGTAMFICNPVSGQWESSVPPQCVPVRCPLLATPLHGYTYPPSCNNSVYQTSCWVSCDDGYSLSHGNGLMTCVDDGFWSTQLPNCIPTDCGPPPSAGSLLASYSSTLINSTAIYTCSHCHTMLGVANENTEVVCGNDGNWRGFKPMCAPVHCPPVIAPPYGSAQIPSLQCGAHVRYSCDPNFNLIGRSEAECLGDGTWSSPTPHCTTVSCQAPKIVGSNFAEDNSSYPFGSVIHVECGRCRERMVDGVRTDEDTLTCTTKGRWDKTIPTCRWSTCPLPGLLDNGAIEPLGQLYFCGTTVKFSCNQGYILNGTGTNSSMCIVNGTWTEEFPTCEELPVDYCPPPPSPQNHTHFCGSKRTRYLHSTVTYCCDDGYEFMNGVGVETVRCEESGGWNGTAPTCKPITCPTPVLPVSLVVSRVQLGYTQGHEHTYGSKSASEFRYGTRLTLRCVSLELRHSVSGHKHLTCGREGQWDHPVPSCQATGCSIACEAPAPPRNGRIVSIIRPGVGTVPKSLNGYRGVIVGDVTIYRCSHGYYLHGSGSRRCGSNGVWSGQTPRCLLSDQPRSRFISRNPMNTTLWETADSAYFLSTNTIYLACQISTEGVGIALPIRKIDGPPVSRVNARMRAYGSPSRSTQLAIQPRNAAGGHSMAGVYLCEVQSASDSSLRISKTLTVHVHDVLCPTPRPPVHGKLVTMGTVLGSCLHYQCDRGHTLIGSDDRVCLPDGMWTGTTPQCLSLFNATCSSPPPVDHASLTTPISSGSYRINDIVSYECGQGYLVTGESSRRCLGGDRWSGEGPRCERGGEKKGHEE